MVPPDHRLRKIDAVLDLSFVREAVAACYSENRGRPSIDPELFLRMLLLGRLYDLSDRKLCTEMGIHAGVRWFCRLDLHDEVPDHSTLSELKDKWSEAGVIQKVFDRVVRQCSEAGLVSGRHVSIDGTEALALPARPEIASLDAGYGTGEFAAGVLDGGAVPHMPLQAAATPEKVPTWTRRTFDLTLQRRRREKVRRA